MEQRTLIAVVLSILVLVVFQYFFVPDQPVPPQGTQSTQNQEGTKPQGATQDRQQEGQTGQAAGGNGASSASGAGALNKEAQQNVLKSALPASLPPSAAGGRSIRIETSLYSAEFTEMGGAVKGFVLKKYKKDLDDDSPGINLVNVSPPLLPLGLKIGSATTLDLRSYHFKSPAPSLIELKAPGEEAKLEFVADLGDGAVLRKVFTIKNDSYYIHMTLALENAGAGNYSILLYNRPFKEDNRYIFTGPSYYAAGSLNEVKLDKTGESLEFSGNVDWLSYGDNYFMTAVIPELTQGPWNLKFTKLADDGLTESAMAHAIAPDRTSPLIADMGLYFGPKEIERLKAVGHNLASAINFGWFDPIAKPLLYLLNFLNRYLHNYGVAIIVLTILIKLAFWPLAQKSAKSMKTMQKLQPKLQKLKEKYGDDKERLNKELMQLYRTYKVNPMSGCLPMIIQIPVFFALYKVLLMAIELRHAPFALWINDLSAPDRLMIPGVEIPMLGGIPVLTLLMGASMWLQQKMSPTSMDPTQAKMMQFLPVIFTFMFINFPSGLVLYWLVNNILSIVQQYYVNKFTD